VLSLPGKVVSEFPVVWVSYSEDGMRMTDGQCSHPCMQTIKFQLAGSKSTGA